MPASYLDYADNGPDNQTGSPPLRFPEGWSGSHVNGAMAALAAAVRNLGDASAKLPAPGGVINQGPNSGQLGTAAFLDAEDIDAESLALKSRAVVGKDLRLFYGTLAQAEDEEDYGWAVCDGRTVNGTVTPDLRGKFPQFYSATDTGTSTGGATSKTTSSDGSHNHGGTTGSTALTPSQVPVSFGTTIVESGSPKSVAEAWAGTASGHTHTISTQAAHSHTISDVRPLWVAVIPLLWVGVP